MESEEEQIKYIPLQAKEGDLAIFLLSGATEVLCTRLLAHSKMPDTQTFCNLVL